MLPADLHPSHVHVLPAHQRLNALEPGQPIQAEHHHIDPKIRDNNVEREFLPPAVQPHIQTGQRPAEHGLPDEPAEHPEPVLVIGVLEPLDGLHPGRAGPLPANHPHEVHDDSPLRLHQGQV